MAINSLSTGFRPGVCTSSTRPTAPYEGQQIYETDTDKLLVWNGSAWLYLSTPQTTEIGGAWESYTPTLTNYVSSGSTSKYVRINKLIIWEFNSSVSTGTAGEISLTLPITAAATVTQVGARNFGVFYDSSAADSYIMAMFIPTTTTVKFFYANSLTPSVLNGSSVAVSDEISFTLIYEGV